MPIFVFLFIGVVMIGNIWLGRVELENALEAAALAAVKDWAESGVADTFSSRGVGIAYAGANTVGGVAVDIRTNYDVTGGVNQNGPCDPTKPGPLNVPPPDGNLVFGAVTIVNPGLSNEQVTFNAGTAPSCASGNVIPYAVLAQAIAPVANPLCASCKLNLGPHYVNVKTVAMYDCVLGRPRLIRVDAFNCP